MAVLTFIGVFAMVSILWIYGIVSYGFVATKLWAWFVVPVFHTTVTFGILQAAGLFMFVRFFVHEERMSATDPDETAQQKISKIILPIIVPWITLFFGWVLHFML
jgi:hypothetical protein